MDSFMIQKEVVAHIKVESTQQIDRFFLINFDEMMCMFANKNHDTSHGAMPYYEQFSQPIRESKDGLMHYDGSNWIFFEDRVQQAYLNYVAEKALLDE